jgi:hypothetical protein
VVAGEEESSDSSGPEAVLKRDGEIHYDLFLVRIRYAVLGGSALTVMIEAITEIPLSFLLATSVLMNLTSPFSITWSSRKLAQRNDHGTLRNNP